MNNLDEEILDEDEIPEDEELNWSTFPPELRQINWSKEGIDRNDDDMEDINSILDGFTITTDPRRTR